MSVFGTRAFAVLFVILLSVPALPLPTGGVTHVLELTAIVAALQLLAGRDEIWLPQRWRAFNLDNHGGRRSIAALIRTVRLLERASKPRLRFLFSPRVSNSIFGLLVVIGSAAAFLAPPFSGLDTLPALGVVLLSLGVVLEDAALASVGIAVAALGIALEVLLATAALHALGRLI